MAQAKAVKDDINKQVTLNLNPWHLVYGLMALIGLILLLWMPWNSSARNKETISVQGESVVEAEADEFVFHPTYQFKDADQNVALQKSTGKTEAIIAKLKELGVEENRIEVNAYGHEGYYEPQKEDENNEFVLTANLTVTVGDRELAQKVEDYLLSTTPQGAVTPSAQLSREKRKELESSAREQAIEDARKKAEDSAELLGRKVGKATEIKDDNNPFTIYDFGTTELGVDSSAGARSSFQVTPTLRDYTYTISIVFELK